MAATPEEVLGVIGQHPHRESLSARALAVARSAFTTRRPEILSGSSVADLAGDPLPALDAKSAETPFGNVLVVLDGGPKGADEWALVSALCALQYATLWRDTSKHPEVLGELLWLATHTGLDPWPALDQLLDPDGRSALWSLLGATLEEGAQHRGEQLVALFALLRARSPEAEQVAQNALVQVDDPLAVSVLAQFGRSVGPLVGVPERYRSKPATVLLAVTGLLLVLAVAGAIAKFALQLRRTARWHFSPRGIEFTAETRVFGRLVRERQGFVPLEHLRSVNRLTRYDGAGLYAGLFALAVGSYLGVAWVTDGLRAPGGSPSLLALGLAALALGVLLDFALTRWFGYHAGTVRLLVRARFARPLVIREVSAAEADAALGRVVQFRGFSKY